MRHIQPMLSRATAFRPTLTRGFAAAASDKQSFVKRLFYGDIDKEQIHPFPCALDEDGKETLQMLVDPVNKFFTVCFESLAKGSSADGSCLSQEKIDSTKVDLDHSIPDEVCSVTHTLKPSFCAYKSLVILL